MNEWTNKRKGVKKYVKKCLEINFNDKNNLIKSSIADCLDLALWTCPNHSISFITTPPLLCLIVHNSRPTFPTIKYSTNRTSILHFLRRVKDIINRRYFRTRTYIRRRRFSERQFLHFSNVLFCVERGSPELFLIYGWWED